jgi:hypothetical protein
MLVMMFDSLHVNTFGFIHCQSRFNIYDVSVDGYACC